MAEEKQIYLVSVSNGLVLAHCAAGNPSGVVAQNRGDKDSEQKWVVEAGDKENTIALKNVYSGKYLHANGGGNWATCGTGERQLWTVSKDRVTPPGACTLQPVEYGKVYLNHFQGQRVPKGHPGMKVHMWQWEEPWSFCLTWYFMDAEIGFGPTAVGAPAGAGESSKSKEELAAKVKDLEEREAMLAQKTKDNDIKSESDKSASAEVKKQREELEKREAELAKKTEEQSTKAESDSKAAEDMKRQREELEKREADLVEKTKNQAAQQDKEGQESNRQSSEREAELEKKLKDVDDRQKELDEREKKLEEQADSQATDEQKKKDEDLQRREKELDEREKKLENDAEKGDPDSSEEMKTQKEDLEKREKALGDREKQAKEEVDTVISQRRKELDNQAQKQSDEQNKKAQDLQKREKELAKREKLLQEKNDADTKRNTETNGASGCSHPSEHDARTRDLDARERALTEREQQLASPQNTAQPNGHSGKDQGSRDQASKPKRRAPPKLASGGAYKANSTKSRTPIEKPATPSVKSPPSDSASNAPEDSRFSDLQKRMEKLEARLAASQTKQTDPVTSKASSKAGAGKVNAMKDAQSNGHKEKPKVLECRCGAMPAHPGRRAVGYVYEN
nr:hypothetical protein B0A51_02012 [Rachicladosporium sp. CCFEE 5018]